MSTFVCKLFVMFNITFVLLYEPWRQVFSDSLQILNILGTFYSFKMSDYHLFTDCCFLVSRATI